MTPKDHRQIGIWLLCGCFLIFCMVVIGGITRLTGSGLSITEWNPIMGAVPPMNEAEWQTAFEKYKQIPQFRKINYDFTLEDFKNIFFWEYLHRLIGRLIGVVFLIPFAWFLIKKKFDKKTFKKVLFLFALGGLQGFLGWFMVKSGLTERTSVSHIRLAIHLLTAFITFGFTFYFALEVLMQKAVSIGKKYIQSPIENQEPHGLIQKEPGFDYSQKLKFDWNKTFAQWFLGIVILQLIYGAFVAGLHAGKIYNTFPLMNGEWIPPGMLSMEPFWLNFFDNLTTVQFIHRLTAVIIVAMVIYMMLPFNRKILSTSEKTALTFLALAVALQFLLGIFTLLTGVNITLAVLHQAGAFFVFAAGVYMLFLKSASRSQEDPAEKIRPAAVLSK